VPSIGIADKTTLDAIKTKIDTNLDGKISDIGSNISPIKSIQRGILANDAISKDAHTDITISSVNMSKAFVNLSSILAIRGDEPFFYGVHAFLTSSTNLRFKSDTRNGWNKNRDCGSVAWEVIEFN